MKPRLLDYLCCPDCGGAFSIEVGEQENGEIITGSLQCAACSSYPIVDGIPRILRHARERLVGNGSGVGRFDELQRRTQRSFGFQWTRFATLHQVFEEDFLNYIAPLQPEFFPGRLILDAGCGFGRHLYYAATYGAEVVGVDLSAAIDRAQRNTAHLPGVHLVQCDLYHLPFRPGTFDGVYSIGVLHHLPDPEAGFRNLLRVLKPDAPIVVWVYSSKRRGTNAALELVRGMTTRLPLPMVHALAWGGALIDWSGFIVWYRLLRRWPFMGEWVERHTWPRIKRYSRYPFEVCVADWLDRLSVPVRFYYDAEQLRAWCARGALTEAQVAPTGLYGWRVCGRRSQSRPGVVAQGVSGGMVVS